MKNKLLSLLIVLCLVLVCGIVAAEMKPFAFPFIGKWQPAEDPVLIDDYGFQDIQNLRKSGKRLKGVSGHSKINTTKYSAPTNTYIYPKNLYHFRKPDESHLIVYSTDSGGNNGRLYQNETAIPSQGDFSSTILYTLDADADLARFSSAPKGNVIICDGEESLIWGGDEYNITSFITSASTITYAGAANPSDYSEEVSNTNSSSTEVATIPGPGYWVVGTTRPTNALYYTVSSANTEGGSLAGWYWNGTTWTSLSITDNTSVITGSGSTSWSSLDGLAEPLYLEGLALYWTRFYYSGGTAQVSNVTASAPMRDVVNIWDGIESTVASCLHWDDGGSLFLDYTDEVVDDSNSYFINLQDAAATDYILLGFAEQQQGFNIYMLPIVYDSAYTVGAYGANSNANTQLTVSYWNGSSWVSVSNLHDGTMEGTIGLAKTGVVTFSPISKQLEQEKSVNNGPPFYYYKIQWAAALDSHTYIYHVKGIRSPQDVRGYVFPAMFQGRSFLFNEKNGDKNKAIYSVFNSPDIWNGSDSGELYFGNDEPLTAATVLYNMYRTSGIEQLIVTKENETYRVFGDGPENWETQKMSGNIGCIAPFSMATCDVSETEEDGKRQVAIWVSASGVEMCDGATISSISEDIKNYWDPTSDDFIPTDRQGDSVGWYDSALNAYGLLISSGTGQTTHNVELEFSLKYNEWTKIYRENSSGANPLQVGSVARDTNGKTYTYGGTNEGYVYRLENGKTWDGTPITQYVKTKALLLDSEAPLFRHTVIDYFRLMYETKATGTGEDLDIIHYCDGTTTATVDGVLSQAVPSDIDMADGPYATRGAVLGPCLTHTFLLTAAGSTVYDGWELTGMGLYYTPDYTIQEDGVQ